MQFQWMANQMFRAFVGECIDSIFYSFFLFSLWWCIHTLGFEYMHTSRAAHTSTTPGWVTNCQQLNWVEKKNDERRNQTYGEASDMRWLQKTMTQRHAHKIINFSLRSTKNKHRQIVKLSVCVDCWQIIKCFFHDFLLFFLGIFHRNFARNLIVTNVARWIYSENDCKRFAPVFRRMVIVAVERNNCSNLYRKFLFQRGTSTHYHGVVWSTNRTTNNFLRIWPQQRIYHEKIGYDFVVGIASQWT